MLLIGVRHVRSGTLTLGQLLLVLGYLGQLYDPLKTISRKAAGIQAYLASAERVFGVLDERPDVPERTNARPLERAEGAVAFHDVSFGYEPARSVLHDVSFELSPGARVAVVGTTGAGKTSLVSLLTRFYDPTAGAITFSGSSESAASGRSVSSWVVPASGRSAACDSPALPKGLGGVVAQASNRMTLCRALSSAEPAIGGRTSCGQPLRLAGGAPP